MRKKYYDRLWLQPAAGDAGGALGAALVAYHLYKGEERLINGSLDAMQGGYLGPNSRTTRSRALAQGRRRVRNAERRAAARCLCGFARRRQGAWLVPGRMEFGPRALGARSILGDARSPTMQKTLNLKVKYRESFRPFAPSVLAEDAAKYFDLDCESLYMLLCADVAQEHCIPMTEAQRALFGIDQLNVPRSSIPAVTHVDYSARVQTCIAKPIQGIGNFFLALRNVQAAQ